MKILNDCSKLWLDIKIGLSILNDENYLFANDENIIFKNNGIEVIFTYKGKTLKLKIEKY